MKTIWCCYVLLIVVFVNGYDGDKKEYVKDPWRGIPMVCSIEDPKNTSISCHGVRIVKRVIQQLLESAASVPSIEITEGISLVESSDATRKARNMKNSIIGFLEGRELRVKLPNLLPSNFVAAIKGSLPTGRGDGGGGIGNFGSGGGKKGDNSVVILALMMGKMLGVMGFGALGLLAMKALMVSSLALMLSLIIAAKKFASSGSSEGHHVVYAQEVTPGHHVKRSIDSQFSPFRGYAHRFGASKSI